MIQEQGICYDVIIKDDSTNDAEPYTIYVNYIYQYYEQTIINCDIIDDLGTLYINQNIPRENIIYDKKSSQEDCNFVLNHYFDSLDY